MSDSRHEYTIPGGFERGSIAVGGLRLNYWRRGRGQPLLILHGVTDWGLDWARFARRVENELDCILLDQRGHGYSDRADDGPSFEQLAADGWQAIEQLGLERPAVLGHSMGGGVALTLAAEHTNSIERLVLVDPAIHLDIPERRGQAPVDAEQRRQNLRRQQALGREALIEQLRAARPTFDPEDVANTVESTLLASPLVWSDQLAADVRDHARHEGQLRRLACPTLVVRGEPARGAIVSDAEAQRIQALVPSGLARVTAIAGTGHIPQREAFDLFVAIVLPFLTGSCQPESEGATPACFAHLLPEW